MLIDGFIETNDVAAISWADRERHPSPKKAALIDADKTLRALDVEISNTTFEAAGMPVAAPQINWILSVMQSEAPAVPGLWATRQFKAVHPPVAVLIVDDEPLSAEALAAALIAYGFRIRIANGGVAALRTPQAWTPHVVVLDIEMPNCDGFTVAEAMRGSTRFAVVPIIAYTSLAEAEVIERGKSVEIDAFYRKGNALPGLFQMIERVAPSAVT